MVVLLYFIGGKKNKTNIKMMARTLNKTVLLSLSCCRIHCCVLYNKSLTVDSILIALILRVTNIVGVAVVLLLLLLDFKNADTSG